MKKKPIKFSAVLQKDRFASKKFIDKLYITHIIKSRKFLIYLLFIILVGIYFLISGSDSSKQVLDTSVELESSENRTNSTSFTLRQDEFLFDVLKELGINGDSLVLLAGSDKKKLLNKVQVGSVIEVDYKDDGQLDVLVISSLSDTYMSFIRGQKNGKSIFTSKEGKISKVSYGSFFKGVIDDSFYMTALESGMSNAMIMNVVKIFEGSIDFIYDIRKGDEFAVLADNVYNINGDELEPRIRKVMFKVNNKQLEAYRFEESDGDLVGFYDKNAKSFASKFLRVPVDLVRITSRFNPKRLHPLFNKSMPHYGTDYAGTIGTPTFSIADGKISFIGVKKGYGNVIYIDHGRGYTTRYAHLNGFRRGLKNGSKVKQREVIGYIGKTGYATGPHLHFEFRLNGAPIDFERAKLPQTQTLSAKQKEIFFDQMGSVEKEFLARMQAYDLKIRQE